jgi:plastocyanin
MVGVSSELVVLNATVPDGISLHFFGSNLTNRIYEEASLGSPLAVSLLLSAAQNTAPGDYKIIFGAQSGTLSMDYTLTVHVVQYLVVAANSAFSPLKLNVKVGSTVYWMNLDVDDNAEYSVIFNGISVESPPLNPSPTNDIFSYTFTTPGNYTYYDGYIPELVGTITVTS